MHDERVGGEFDLAREPYLDVFGRFWEGVSFLIASTCGMRDLVSEAEAAPILTTETATEILDRYVRGLDSGIADWPAELLIWQSYAYTVVQAHGLLDEYLRACYELLSLADSVATEIDLDEGWEAETAEHALDIERQTQLDSERFQQLMLWQRMSHLRKRFGLRVNISRPLTAALKHQRHLRNSIVHGQLMPHVVMPDGTIGHVRIHPPPPYVPLGPHIVRGSVSVLLAAHREVDAAILRRLDIPEDEDTAALIAAEIEAGRDQWLADPWAPDPEHLFSAEVLARWRPVGN